MASKGILDLAEWHINILRESLEERGWMILDELSGDSERLTKIWVLQRHESTIQIQFEGFDENGVFTFYRSFGCHLKGKPEIGVYLPKRKPRSSRPHAAEAWEEELDTFLDELDTLLSKD